MGEPESESRHDDKRECVAGKQHGLILGFDPVYRDALGAAWPRLDPAVRRRFSVRPRGNTIVRYAGTMRVVSLSLMGWLFAQACRLIGMPLVPVTGQDVAMHIELRDNTDLGGTTWWRFYRFGNGSEYVVSSTKCKGPGNECIEYITRRFLMRLRLSEVSGALVFTSTAYAFRLFGHNLRIPDMLTPGVTTVVHRQLHDDRFRFSLSVDHPWFGRTVFQDGEFYSVRDR